MICQEVICVFLRKISRIIVVKTGGICPYFMFSKKYCLHLIKMYYSNGSLQFSGREAVGRALKKSEDKDPYLRVEYDRLFSYFFETDRRNVNAVSIRFFISPASVYRRLDRLCYAVKQELLTEKKYRIAHVEKS